MRLHIQGTEVARLWEAKLLAGSHGLPEDLLLLMGPGLDLWPGDAVDVRCGESGVVTARIRWARVVSATDDAESARQWAAGISEGRSFVARPCNPYLYQELPFLHRLAAV